ncbi:uncharacterized protein BJX67DRAFT_342247 [Aspergillus lucknowensis]|uniref:GPI anchored serine-threonine rich protein n=1 Tax=Aspergillus lucknowensis TaxID=176173 RepID=A0ABR4M4D5_9EURO
MHASVLFLGAMLGSHAVASHLVMPLKRQTGNAFDPTEDEGCDPSWPRCGNTDFCYNTAEDYTCCPAQEHVCPPGTFCMQPPYCCFDEYDPETCAEEFGIPLEPTSTPTRSTPLIPTYTSSPTSTPTTTSSSVVPPTETETETETEMPEMPEFTDAASAKVAGGAVALLGWVGIFFGNILI